MWERKLPPTISVSQSTIYITGTSEDNLSGTAIYRYDPPNNQGDVKNVDNISTELFTAPQFELTTSGIWKFTGIDQAGNSDSADTEDITLYLCNYCNQKTIQLHYSCSLHSTHMGCSTSSGTCYYATYCAKTPCYTSIYTGRTGRGSNDNYACPACKKTIGKATHYYWYYTCYSHIGQKAEYSTVEVGSCCNRKGSQITLYSYPTCPIETYRCTRTTTSSSRVL